MIAIETIKSFSEVATEILVAFEEGHELKQVYPLLKRWQAILDALPKSDRPLQPWIVCNIPEGASLSYVIHTYHPTIADDNWTMEWMPYDITPEEEAEVKEHLRMMFEAWLRAEKRRSTVPIGPTYIKSQIAKMIEDEGGMSPKESAVSHWERKHRDFTKPIDPSKRSKHYPESVFDWIEQNTKYRRKAENS